MRLILEMQKGRIEGIGIEIVAAPWDGQWSGKVWHTTLEQ
jgi:hypothetical protein